MTIEWIRELCPEISEWQAELVAEHVEQRVQAEREVLRAEAERYRTAITHCIDFAAGRESEWGERAISAFGILEAALAAGME